MSAAGARPRLIIAVVPRGEGDRHAGAAIRAGAQAATVFVGRGYDAHQQVGASGLAIQAEKEVLLTVVDPGIAGDVARAMVGAAADGYGASDRVITVPVAHVVGLLEAIREDAR
ncbi:MAG: hypothetical protein HYY42_02960 [Chloroflexi bacterium]|nr:hypothetical protein [Chloroflexota bacterium]MBI2983133.1 hypothetical protein [Chloroflexota bacterium]